jgi:hypothetical protein
MHYFTRDVLARFLDLQRGTGESGEPFTR